MVIGQRGQAALSDAMFFLMIVAGLSAFLFAFDLSYGQDVDQRLRDHYWSQYATSSLETILYSSTPRIPGESLETAEEIDYLLAAVKEDYADDKELDTTAAVLTDNIAAIMEPFSGSSNYMFYMYLLDSKRFVFTMLYVSAGEVQLDSTGQFVAQIAPISITGEEPSTVPVARKNMILHCAPESLLYVDDFTATVGATASSDARMQLIELAGDGTETYPPAKANLTIWVPTTADLSRLRCQVYKTIEITVD